MADDDDNEDIDFDPALDELLDDEDGNIRSLEEGVYVEEEEEEEDEEEEAEEEEVEVEDEEKEEVEEIEEKKEGILRFELNDNTLSHVKNVKIVKPDNRITSEMMTQAEMTGAICYRAEQMEKNATCFTDVDGLTNPILRAVKELNDHKSPLILRRFINATECEEFKVSEMGIPQSNA